MPVPYSFNALRATPIAASGRCSQTGTPVHVVAQRLGHAKVTMTLEAYAHALPNMQQDAAARLGALLHG